MDFNPISQDPTYIDTDYPAHLTSLNLISGGHSLLNSFYKAQGAQPHPAVLLLHGIPGMERNFDLAHILRRAGWHMLIVHYRGNWGSSGTFSFSNVLEDSKHALETLRDASVAEQHLIDPQRITVIGHSMGGWAALMLAAAGIVDSAASIAGVNFGMWGELLRDEPDSRPEALAFFNDVQAPLHGSSGQALVDELIAHAEAWNIFRQVEGLVDKKLLLIAGERDDTTPIALHHSPLVTLLENAGAPHISEAVMDAKHAFLDKRVELAQMLLNWLQVTN